MMKTVKHTFSSIGDHSGDVARVIGAETALLARRLGGGSATLARRVGPRRGLIGLAVLAAAVGGTIILVRYLKARAEEANADADSDAQASDLTANKRTKSRPADARIQH